MKEMEPTPCLKCSESVVPRREFGDTVLFALGRVVPKISKDDGAHELEKICDHVRFPESLTLDNGDAHRITHRLRAVVEHIGPSAHSGHYVAYVIRRPHYDRYVKVDDEHVDTWTTFDGTATSPGIRSVQACVLLYEGVQ